MVNKKYLVVEKGSDIPIVAECTREGAEVLVKAFEQMQARKGLIKKYEIIEKEVNSNGNAYNG